MYHCNSQPNNQLVVRQKLKTYVITIPPISNNCNLNNIRFAATTKPSYVRDFLSLNTYSETHLSYKDEFIFFKQASARVVEHRESNEVNKIENSCLDLISRFCSFNSFSKHNTECLELVKSRACST